MSDKRSGKDRRVRQIRRGERRTRKTPVKVDRRSGAERRVVERRSGKDRRKD